MKLPRLALVALGVVYAEWAARFIASSVVQTDEGRRFCLFDDAMITLRYAWNLAHGSGLVWNPGERVEGTTSFLSAIYMSLGAIFLDKSETALFVQVSGIALVLGVALLSHDLGRLLDMKGHFGLITVAAVLAYYPLSYWSLMGMETGLLTALSTTALLVAVRLGSDPQGSKFLGGIAGADVCHPP
jgi:arabinofuranosyltransferase